MNSASALASSVLPTPVGPAKMKLPIGRLGSLSPARLRRTASLIRLMASDWEMTFFWISSSIRSSRVVSSVSSRVSGMPVILLTTSAMTSSSTVPSISLERSRHSRVIVSFFFLSLSAWSRRAAARSKSWLATASSLSWLSRSICSSSSLRSGGRVMALSRTRAPGLVDHVDGLVGQAAAGDVAVRELDGGLEGLVGDLDAMVGLVAVAQAAEDLQRLGLAGRLDDDRLEPALQRAVLLDVLAVLVERGGADALHLAAGEGRLEHVGGVDRPLRAAGADQGVQLVDEQDRVLGAADLVHHGLDPLLELAAVLGAGDHHREIQHHDPAIAQQLGNVAVDDHLGQALDDRRLADAGLAEQHRVVLGAARQHLNHALDFILAANDRIQLPLPCQVGQVASERVQSRGLGLVAF